MREHISLTGTWKLSSLCEPGSGLRLGYAGDDLPPHTATRTRPWIDAAVPGSVQQTLLEAGDLPEPFYGDNLDHWRWVESREWWYRTSFTTPVAIGDRRVRLCFTSLDTCATVFLNGQKIATHANMFRPLEIDVTDTLRQEEDNVLAVQLEPVDRFSGYEPGDGTAGFVDVHRVHTRKPQFSFGWDIAPRLMTVGIPGGVHLELLDALSLISATVRTLRIDSAGADVELVVEIENSDDATRTLNLSATVAESAITKTIEVHSGLHEYICPVRLEDIALWQVRGRGAPALHDCKVEIAEAEHFFDSTCFRFGVRTVELLQEPQDDGGTSFRFAVNGEYVFITGLNYTPGDALLTRIDDARTDELLELAFNCNVNLLRVWGGGYYETEHFYQRCDEAGVLVWQDFMLGCGLYPQNDVFVAEVKKEAEYQLRRLRHHPSLAVLAGDNENDCFHYYAGSDAFRSCRLTRGVLQQASEELCPELPYIPSSPLSPVDSNPLCTTEGDNHLWNHEAPHDAEPYASDNSRFMSEMGRLSLPPMTVIESFLPVEEQMPLTSRLWRYHAADSERAGFGERMESLLACLAASGYDTDASLEELVERTQQLQAKALVYWAEKYYNSPVCGGIILWNLCDCWPQMSDAIVAYPNIPKPAYDALRDAYGRMI